MLDGIGKRFKFLLDAVFTLKGFDSVCRHLLEGIAHHVQFPQLPHDGEWLWLVCTHFISHGVRAH